MASIYEPKLLNLTLYDLEVLSLYSFSSLMGSDLNFKSFSNLSPVISDGNLGTTIWPRSLSSILFLLISLLSSKGIELSSNSSFSSSMGSIFPFFILFDDLFEVPILDFTWLKSRSDLSEKSTYPCNAFCNS